MTEATKEKAPKQMRITNNGVVRPSEGTKTGRVWEIADEISQANQAPAARGEVLKQCEAEDINQATGATQYGRWCKFNDVPKPPRAEKKEKAPKKEKKEKAAPVEEVAVEEDEDFPE